MPHGPGPLFPLGGHRPNIIGDPLMPYRFLINITVGSHL